MEDWRSPLVLPEYLITLNCDPYKVYIQYINMEYAPPAMLAYQSEFKGDAIKCSRKITFHEIEDANLCIQKNIWQ